LEFTNIELLDSQLKMIDRNWKLARKQNDIYTRAAMIRIILEFFTDREYP